ncbi:MAG: alpha/beta hydrolase [Burkholderiales bacterium]|jgi:pimeloyl-ACP methyl ester carboxylesterase|uniref:alpha/beta fold hydrolase n=1 Tax=Limnobacter sp. TaxID=2003368 RepID=UPI003920E957|nr:alpha/beta hydrolase [Burkholderiales bacterium]
MEWSHFYRQAKDFEKNLIQPDRLTVALNQAPLNINGVPAKTHVLVWGKGPDKPVVLCAGGLVNTAYRFAMLAQTLCTEFECVSFDWYGRGHSDHLQGPQSYGFESNVGQVQALLEMYKGRPIHFLGSSLGGMVAMAVFSQAQYVSNLRSLVLNDVGPRMSAGRRRRRAGALNKPRVFKTPVELREKVGISQRDFGPVPQPIQDFLAYKNTRWCNQSAGRVYRYDMACMARFEQDSQFDVDLWHLWETIHCPQLLLHGALSDALLPDQVQQMQQAKPDLKVVTVPDAGHTPSLCVESQVQMLQQWLCSH